MKMGLLMMTTAKESEYQKVVSVCVRVMVGRKIKKNRDSKLKNKGRIRSVNGDLLIFSKHKTK